METDRALSQHPSFPVRKTLRMEKLSVCKISHSNDYIHFKDNLTDQFLKRYFNFNTTPDSILHQQIQKQPAAGVNGIIHLTDRERDTPGRGTCLHLNLRLAAE